MSAGDSMATTGHVSRVENDFDGGLELRCATCKAVVQSWSFNEVTTLGLMVDAWDAHVARAGEGEQHG